MSLSFQKVFVYLFLTFVTASSYWQIKDHKFLNWDDQQYITENKHVNGGFKIEEIAWSFSSFHSCNWHPITWLSHMMDSELYGLEPGGHHITNLVYHIFNVLLLFLMLNLYTGFFFRSAFVAALFALHPLHVESVVWAAERKDVLSLFFGLLSLLCYYKYGEEKKSKFYFPALSLFLLGLMAKPMLVTLPMVMLLLDFWPLERISFREDVSVKKTLSGTLFEKIPFFLFSGISCWITLLAQKECGAISSSNAVSVQWRINNSFVSYLKYIWKMVWPSDLSFFYPYSETPLWEGMLAGGIFILISVIFIFLSKKYPFCFTGWLWFVITLLPVIGLVQVGGQAMADRYTYIPLIGLFIIFVWGISEITAKMKNRNWFLWGSGSGIVGILWILTFQQVGYWKNDRIFFSHAVDVNNKNFLAHVMYGEVLIEDGNYSEAVKHYYEALRFKPNYPDALNGLGEALFHNGRDKEAIRVLKKAIEVYPKFSKGHNSLANVYFIKHKFADAIFHYKKAIASDPDNAEAYFNLGEALKITGNQKVNQ